MIRRSCVGMVVAGAAVLYATAPEQAAPDIVAAVAEYPKYHAMLAEPKLIEGPLTTLCRDVSGPLRKKNGPHYGLLIQHYRNAIAFDAGVAGKWPVGAVLVKEKWPRNAFDGQKGKVVPEGITGMIKRAPGTRPASGDWEFFTAEK